MRPIEFIRTQVFKQTQAAFARLAGVSQSTVSKWEAGVLAPSQEEMVRIRSAAIRLAIGWEREPWQDEWFFVIPKELRLSRASV
ncbi:helix-turn-helix domain-containing protein [Rhizobium bangladeshense]|uniref:helix-turn-helix transcriptional regulator n=1 Tax=Rhizobium bangladeshense TaxID=1138189 RepID=UPI001D929251|nr:helix-turn-helix domain-containing protein [Rhizobium bangladeshense]